MNNVKALLLYACVRMLVTQDRLSKGVARTGHAVCMSDLMQEANQVMGLTAVPSTKELIALLIEAMEKEVRP